MSAAAATLKDVTRSYKATRGRRLGRAPREPRRALDSVSLEIREGERLALLGPNGSGKSTLLRLLAAADVADSGDVRVLGQDVGAARGARGVRSRLGVVFQKPSLDALLSVRDNLATHAALFGMGREAAREAVARVAREFAFEDRLEDLVRTLSGGLARRVDLARALLHAPSLLLLDEPTTGLDPQARLAFLDALDARRADGALTIVFSTHLFEEAERCDRVALLDRGRLVALGAPDELRAALGGLVVRCGAAYEHALRDARLTVSQAPPRDVVGAGDAPAVERAALALTALAARDGAAAAFQVGPPTLADVYLARTGRALAEEPPDA